MSRVARRTADAVSCRASYEPACDRHCKRSGMAIAEPAPLQEGDSGLGSGAALVAAIMSHQSSR